MPLQQLLCSFQMLVSSCCGRQIRPHLQSHSCPTRTLSFCFYLFFFRHTQDGMRNSDTPHPPPMVSCCSFSKQRSATGGKQRAGSHGVHKFMNHVVAGTSQQLLQHANGVLGLLPPCLCQSLSRCVPAAHAAWLPPCHGSCLERRCTLAHCLAELPSVQK